MATELTFYNRNILLLFLILSVTLFAKDSIEIKGKITDALTGESLMGANLFLVGTALGAAADLDGNYIIRNIDTGEYVLKVSYLGYKSQEVTIKLEKGKTLESDFQLEHISIEGETVVITAQAKGQKQAINKQLSSTNITNVVSAARIQDVPDANAAESVGRLPGVSILRDGGEGSKVVIRGLAPKFNSITINGVNLSSSDGGDRSVDLSMISSSMLAGIEVSKSITADMDGNVIGGVINFELREAKTNNEGGSILNATIKGGHNGLDNAKGKFKNYKLDLSYEDRYFDEKLGLFVQGAYEERNLSSNELGALYNPFGNSETDYLVNNFTINDILRIRDRGNAVLSLDYKFPEGKIKFSNLFNLSSTELNNRGQIYNVDRGANTQSFTGAYKKNNLQTMSNILSLRHNLSIFQVKAVISHSYSETDSPDAYTVTFTNNPAGIAEFGSMANIDIQDVVKAANNNIESTLLQKIASNSIASSERVFAASLDFETELKISDFVTIDLKFGGKYDYKTRSYTNEVIDGQSFGFASGGALISQLQKSLSWFNHTPGDNLNVPFNQFIDSNFDYGNFMDSEYKMIHPLNFDRLNEMVDFMNNNQLNENITYNNNIGSSITNNYDGTENISAAYLMATLNIGSQLTIIPGLRYQELKTSYSAPQGIQGPFPFSDYQNEMKTVTSTHPYFLPSILVQYKPFNWFDVRFAYTNTLSYPDYAALTPRINVALTQNSIAYNGFELKPMKAKNFDVYFSFYNNTIGLFTVGLFKKEISDFIYQYTFTPETSEDLLEYYPEWVENKQPRAGVQVTKWINNQFKIDNYGIEVDWQTHFWYLPSVLSGLVLNVNYTHIFSEANYPLQLVVKEGRRVTYVDTSFTAPLLYQPDDIINVTLGYDYKDYSFRLSTLFTTEIFTDPVVFPQLRASTDAYTRWDITMKQKMPFIIEGFEMFMNYSNISGARDISSIAAETGVPRRIQAYGSMLELGLRVEL